MKVARRAVNFSRWELWELTRMQTSCCGIKGSLQERGKPCASVKMGGRQGFLPGVGILTGIWAAEGAHRDAGACGSVGADHGPRRGGSWSTSLPWLWMLCLHLEPMPLLSSCHLSGLSFHPGRDQVSLIRKCVRNPPHIGKEFGWGPPSGRKQAFTLASGMGLLPCQFNDCSGKECVLPVSCWSLSIGLHLKGF